MTCFRVGARDDRQRSRKVPFEKIPNPRLRCLRNQSDSMVRGDEAMRLAKTVVTVVGSIMIVFVVVGRARRDKSVDDPQKEAIPAMCPLKNPAGTVNVPGGC